MAAARLPIVSHLGPDEIARRYRTCRDAREKTHWQALWLLTRPDPTGPPRRPTSPRSSACCTRPAWRGRPRPGRRSASWRRG
jgi:hypothetical protein